LDTYFLNQIKLYIYWLILPNERANNFKLLSRLDCRCPLPEEEVIAKYQLQ